MSTKAETLGEGGVGPCAEPSLWRRKGGQRVAAAAGLGIQETQRFSTMALKNNMFFFLLILCNRTLTEPGQNRSNFGTRQQGKAFL